MAERTIKWGIIATGAISEAFVEGMRHVSNSEIIAVASRDINKSEAYRKKHDIKKAYGSYLELAEDQELDAIYISTPHPYHKELSLMCLEHGKAVLCEKPAVMNSKELDEVLESAANNTTFYMEAMWTRFLPVIKRVKELIKDGYIGDVRMIKADFCFKAPYDPNSRLFDKALGGGALLDVGIYPISFASYILEKSPVSIKSFAEIGKTGVDEQGAAILGYSDGEIALLSFAVNTQTEWNAYIHGSDGYIKLPQFFMARQATLVKGDKEEVITPAFAGNGYNYEIEEVNQCLREGKIQSSIMGWEDTKLVMDIMDELRRQWKLVYPSEI